MLFNSYEFVILVVATLLLYYLPALRAAQRYLLIVSSFVFYAASQPVLVLLLLGSITLNALTSHGVRHGAPERRVAYATLGVVLNLLLLAFFKYSPLIGSTLFESKGGLGAFLVSIPLPIGISFFTFQGITLLVDTLGVERERVEFTLPDLPLDQHAVNTALYVAFFPQLVAGPIVKAHEFLPQIKPKFLSDVDWAFCFRSLVTGYFLKMVVADNLDEQTFWITHPYFETFGSITLLAMLFGYSMQIFADFAGYSLIAIGVAGLYGYRLPDNFKFPYVAASLAEFWQRWHISLSSFLKEYLYFPLGGNRNGALRTYLNLMIVMLLGGLWHGAAWSFMVWGGAHGLALAVERFCSNHIRLPANRLFWALRVVLVFSFVTAAWLLFKLTEFSHAVGYGKAIFTNFGFGENLHLVLAVAFYGSPVILYHLHYLIRDRIPEGLNRLSFLAYGMQLFLIVTNSGTPHAFVYFQF